jgi:hypothetical protein
VYRKWIPESEHLLPPWGKPGLNHLYYVLEGDRVALHPVEESILPPWGEVPVWRLLAGFLGWSPRVGRSYKLIGKR